jgi:hypothetical protein
LKFGIYIPPPERRAIFPAHGPTLTLCLPSPFRLFRPI